jgi:hypothetical protein
MMNCVWHTQKFAHESRTEQSTAWRTTLRAAVTTHLSLWNILAAYETLGLVHAEKA